MIDDIKIESEKRMQKSIESLKKNLTKIRTGRANTSLLDQVTVDYYGSPVPLNQIANVGIEDSRTLKIAPWEKDMVQPIEKAIMKADLGLNPTTAGMIIRIPLPPLTEERRRDLIKIVKQEGEQSKISIRNIRREANDKLKKDLKDKKISEDENKSTEKRIQNITDKQISELENRLKKKEKEIMTV